MFKQVKSTKLYVQKKTHLILVVVVVKIKNSKFLVFGFRNGQFSFRSKTLTTNELIFARIAKPFKDLEINGISLLFLNMKNLICSY